MSAYKKLNKQDVFISAYTARKEWAASGSSNVLKQSYGIELINCISGSYPYFKGNDDLIVNRSKTLVWNSLKHLYYSLVDNEGNYTGSFDNYFETSLTSGSRTLYENATLISIPQKLYGDRLEPGSIVIQPLSSYDSLNYSDRYVTDGFVQSDYIEEIDYLYGSNPTGSRVEIIDDGEGNLIQSGSDQGIIWPDRPKVVGNVIYSHGIIIITDPVISRYYLDYLITPHIQWKSNQPIYTYNAYCKVKDSEMSFSQNPTTTVGSFGEIASNIVGEEFEPFVTTVGLYNDANELIAVGKLSRPVPKSRSTDMTFVVKINL